MLFFDAKARRRARKELQPSAQGGEVATMTAGAFSSKAAIAQAFSEIPVFAAFGRSYLGTINQMVEAAWAGGQVGATDSGMMTPSRAVIASYMPELLAAASETLATFAHVDRSPPRSIVSSL